MPDFSPAFWKWFGKSRVVDADGQPLVVYHGTDADVRVFNKANMIDAGFYFTDVREYAENYGANVVVAYLRLENPLLLTHEWFDTRYPTPARMQAEGHDGFIVTRAGGASMFVVFSAKQIKTVDNDGTWDADDPDIRSNPGAKAKVMALAKRLGAKVEVEKSSRSMGVLVEAPHRHVWAGSGVHEIVQSSYRGPWGYEDLWQDVLEAMQYGLAPCTDPNCEWCNDADEED